MMLATLILSTITTVHIELFDNPLVGVAIVFYALAIPIAIVKYIRRIAV